ncbi:hypothetical protein H5410_005204 [Solanum commersonii]|uniref:Uncharacterized protein n=1 Tax=Solanum commersonii TaxID=4109 RepID=A0A9J6A6J5_SOLCO|nr:hypothetical protein H5410_005204 [Solanum commersonii]
MSTLASCGSHSQLINNSLEGGWEEEKVSGGCEKEEGVDVLEGPETGVGKDASAGNEIGRRDSWDVIGLRDKLDRVHAFDDRLLNICD